MSEKPTIKPEGYYTLAFEELELLRTYRVGRQTIHDAASVQPTVAKLEELGFITREPGDHEFGRRITALGQRELLLNNGRRRGNGWR
jgi:DNA-binding IclR family transcriptional regulator